MRNTILAMAAVSAMALGASARAAITVDGTLDGDYGSALTTQTVNTSFGDSTIGDGTSGGGSELDAGYGVIQSGNLDIFLAGNFESNGNHVNVFVADGRAGQNTLAVPSTGTMQTMNGSIFSPEFQATYALDINDFSGTAYVEEYDLTAASGGYVGSIPLTGGIGTGSPGGIITYGWNDTNSAGVNGNTGTAADPTAADAVSTGLEISIPLSLLGNPIGGVSVLADVNGGGDSYISNQVLPGLPVGSGSIASSMFNFSSTPGEYFTVPAGVPEPTSIGLIAGAMTLVAARRRKA